MNGHPLPWLVPCCAGCASRGAAGGVGDAPAPSVEPGKTGAGALVVLGLLFLGVLYGEKVMTRLGG
jgi:hypothetical protein